MLQSTFDLDPKAAIVRIIQRLGGLTNPTGADARVWAWFRSNLKWGFTTPDASIAALDALGRIILSTDVPLTWNTAGNGNQTPGFWDKAFTPSGVGRYPVIAASGNYSAIAAHGQYLFAEIDWPDYAALATHQRHAGPALQSGDLDAVIAATT